ncbi:hypothetical protein KKH39_00640 [Patescibacteria group bacterium]|nr:hypothetical protein [Patescibacteria group bacterium]
MPSNQNGIKISGDKKDCLRLASWLTSTVAKNVAGIREIKLSGTSGLCDRAIALKENQMCLMVQGDQVLWHFCQTKSCASQIFVLKPQNNVEADILLKTLADYLTKICGKTSINLVKALECGPQQLVNKYSRPAISQPEDPSHILYSRRFPQPIKLPEKTEEVYLALLLLLPTYGQALLDVSGVFLLPNPVRLLDEFAHNLGKQKLWWQTGWSQLLKITPKIIERARNGKGMLVHRIRLESNGVLATNLQTKKEAETMPEKTFRLNARQHMVYHSLLRLAGDDLANVVEISRYATRLLKLSSFDIPRGSISNYIKQLTRLGLVENGSQRGNIKVYRQPTSIIDGHQATDPPKKVEKKVAKKGNGDDNTTTDNPDTPTSSKTPQKPGNGSNSLLAILTGGNGTGDSVDQLVEQATRQFHGIGGVLELARRLQEAGFQTHDNNDGTHTISFTTSK